jgi:hypothetical protein
MTGCVNYVKILKKLQDAQAAFVKSYNQEDNERNFDILQKYRQEYNIAKAKENNINHEYIDDDILEKEQISN